MKELIDKLYQTQALDKEELIFLIAGRNRETELYARELARQVRERTYGNRVFIRGLIEFTNYCKNDCYYCGIRRSNKKAARYRLTKEDILDCCRQGYELGFRTFVLQGGRGWIFYCRKTDGADPRDQKRLSGLCSDPFCRRKKKRKNTGLSGRLEPTVICCVTKRQIRIIIVSFIRNLFPWKTESTVCSF